MLERYIKRLQANNAPTLILVYNNIGDKGATTIAEVLKSNTTVTSINLYRNNIGDKGATAIAEALKSNTTVTSLSLGSNNIGDKGATAIAEVLKSNSTVTSLSLISNNIGDKGATAIAEVLKSNTTVASLGLGSNEIGNTGATAIAEALKSNTTVTSLDLDNSWSGSAGAAAIAEMLKTNTTLRVIDLAGNLIGSAGATAIAESLKINTTLRVINLAGSCIGNVGATAIVEALKTNTTVTSLDLSSNNIDDTGATAIAEVLKNNSTLRVIDLGGSYIGNVGAIALVNVFRINITMTSLDLNSNKISDNNIKEKIYDYIERNRKFATHKADFIQLVSADINATRTAAIKTLDNNSSNFYQKHQLEEAQLLLLSLTRMLSLTQTLAAWKSARGTVVTPQEKDKLDKAAEELSQSLNKLMELKDKYPKLQQMVQQALVFFGKLLIKYGDVDNAWQLLAPYCMTDPSVALALIDELFTADDLSNPFRERNISLKAAKTSIYYPAFLGQYDKIPKFFYPMLAKARKARLQFILMLYKNTFEKTPDYTFLCKVVTGLRVNSGELPIDVPSLSSLTGIENAKIISFEQLRQHALNLQKKLKQPNNTLNERLSLITYYTKDGFYALLQSVQEAVKQAQQEKTALDKALLSLASIECSIPYEGLAIKPVDFLPMKRKQPAVKLGTVKAHYNNEYAVKPFEQAQNELMQQATSIIELKKMPEALKRYAQYLKTRENPQTLRMIKRNFFFGLSIPKNAALNHASYVKFIRAPLTSKNTEAAASKEQGS